MMVVQKVIRSPSGQIRGAIIDFRSSRAKMEEYSVEDLSS